MADSRPSTRSVRRVLVVAGLLALGGCEAFPQLQSLQRTASEPRRKKVREHQACLGESDTQDKLIACMAARGYRFIAPAGDPRAQSCHSMLGRQDEFPEAYCFEVNQ